VVSDTDQRSRNKRKRFDSAQGGDRVELSPEERAAREARAEGVWNSAYPLDDYRAAPQAEYLEGRGLDWRATELRAIEGLNFDFTIDQKVDSARPKLAIVARLYATGSRRPVGIHATFLTDNGRFKREEPFTYRRAGRGAVYGLIRWVKDASSAVIAEGIETALSLAWPVEEMRNKSGELVPLPLETVIYTVGSGGMESLIVPPGLKEVIIAVDQDWEDTGLNAVKSFLRNYRGKARAYLPPDGDGDFNDTLRRLKVEALDRSDPEHAIELFGKWLLTAQQVGSMEERLARLKQAPVKTRKGMAFAPEMLEALKWAEDDRPELFYQIWTDMQRGPLRKALDEWWNQQQGVKPQEKQSGPLANATYLAREFLKSYATPQNYLTLHFWRGDFWQWNGSKWAFHDNEELSSDIWKYLASIDEVATKTRIRHEVEAALKALTILDSSTNPPVWLTDTGDMPPAKELVAFANGLLHFPTGRLLPPTPAYFNIAACVVRFDPSAPVPARWFQFLEETLYNPMWDPSGDLPPKELIDVTALNLSKEELELFMASAQTEEQWLKELDAMPGYGEQQLLQEFLGYVLSGDTSQQKFLMMLGVKRSGRSTVARVLQGIMGSDNYCPLDVNRITGEFGLQSLIGKSVGVFADAMIGPRTDRVKLSSILLSIVGEDPLGINRKNLSFWNGTLNTRLIYISNQSPSMVDPTGALRARLLLIRFKVSFLGRENQNLTNELLAEAPGIVNWILLGLRRLHWRGYFLNTAAGEEKIDEIAKLSSPVHEFVDEFCELGAGFSMAKDELWRVFRDWHNGQGYTKEIAQPWFFRDLYDAYPQLRTRRSREGERRFYSVEGIKLLSEDQRPPL
jgi:putative DNA primase/helicase